MQARPLQVVRVDFDNNLVEVDEASLRLLEERLKSSGAEQVSVLAVMGAFRTGKSFLLNMFLHGLQSAKRGSSFRLGEETIIPGAPGGPPGFPFGGGQDALTQGIWIWSEPFIRLARDGRTRIALLLLDSQGAFGGDMTKDQSLTVHGLSTVLASRLIYNIQKQLQSDKMTNVAKFLGFAQSALRREQANVSAAPHLDFVVRDWAHFGDDWNDLQCQQQIDEHLSRHYHPAGSDPNSKLVAASFAQVSCVAFSHPGRAMEKEGWSGRCSDLSENFVQQVSAYVRRALASMPESRTLTGEKLSPANFGDSLRILTGAFRDAAPTMPGFREAVETASCLSAKHNAVAKFCTEIDKLIARHPAGMDPKSLDREAHMISARIQEGFFNSVILAPPQAINDTWEQTRLQIAEERKSRQARNERVLGKPLAWLAPAVLFVLLVSVLSWAHGSVAFAYCSVATCTQDGFSSYIPSIVTLSQYLMLSLIVFSFGVLWIERGPNAAAMGVVDLGVETLGQASRCGEALDCRGRKRAHTGQAQPGSAPKRSRLLS